MTEANKNTGIIVLAAGASRRMGEAKQLLKLDGKSLIRRAVETALAADRSPVTVVLGANFDSVKSEIEDLDCSIVKNDEWKTGISSSIKAGLKKTLEIAPGISAVIFALADQPFVTAGHFDLLIEKFHETGKPIIAARYLETAGVPALFARRMFPALMKLDGDRGAGRIIKESPALTEYVFLPEAATDIDTITDLESVRCKITADDL